MEDNPFVRNAYIAMAAVAGAITSLSLSNYREKTRTEIGLTVFVGTAFAIFFIPWFTVDILKVNTESIKTACGLTYLGGTVANALMPAIVKRVRKHFGLEDEK